MHIDPNVICVVVGDLKRVVASWCCNHLTRSAFCGLESRNGPAKTSRIQDHSAARCSALFPEHVRCISTLLNFLPNLVRCSIAELGLVRERHLCLRGVMLCAFLCVMRNVGCRWQTRHNPFYAGFGNRATDVVSYRAVGVAEGRIYIINPAGEIRHFNHMYRASYTSLQELVDVM